VLQEAVAEPVAQKHYRPDDIAAVCRKLLLSPQLKDSLLVLDDVWRAEVIRSFLLPVRLLVTTQVQLQHSICTYSSDSEQVNGEEYLALSALFNVQLTSTQE